MVDEFGEHGERLLYVRRWLYGKRDSRQEPVLEPVYTSNDDTINYYAYKKLHSRFDGFTSCYDCK